MIKKRILHITEAPGGVERYLVTLLTKMKKYDDEFEHILVCSDLYDAEKFAGLAASVEHVDSLQHKITAGSDIPSIRTVRKLIKKYQPDIVYCHSSKAGAIGRIANYGLHNASVYNAHGWSFNMKGTSQREIRTYEAVEKALARTTDVIVCISEFEKNSALEHGICKEDKIRVIRNGIDFEEISNVRQKDRAGIGIPENAFVVGQIGRLTAQKSPGMFVKMAREIKNRIDNAFFLMIGDGLERRETETLIREAGLQDCTYITGWVDNPLDYAGCIDVGVLLSRWEGFGLVLPEYMIMGKPIVACNVDAIPEILGDAGLLVRPNDYRKAAEYVIRIQRDESLRDRLVQEGKRRVINFNAERTAEEHAELFRSLCRRTAQSGKDQGRNRMEAPTATVKILVASHKTYQMPADDIYLPLHVGAEGKVDEKGQPLDLGWVKDNTGDNISRLNPGYCELTGLYWGWKNLKADYIGLVHYRRHFCLHKRGRDPFKSVLTGDQLRPLLGRYWVFVPKKRQYFIETLYSHYAHTHYAEHLDAARAVIAEQCPEYLPSFDRIMKQRYGHMFNMMIMRRDLADRYCSWLFEILFALPDKMGGSRQLSFYQGRYFGRVSEIILNVWLDHQICAGEIPADRVCELPTIYTEKIMWYKKASSFLRAKYLGKKYEGSF